MLPLTQLTVSKQWKPQQCYTLSLLWCRSKLSSKMCVTWCLYGCVIFCLSFERQIVKINVVSRSDDRIAVFTTILFHVLWYSSVHDDVFTDVWCLFGRQQEVWQVLIIWLWLLPQRSASFWCFLWSSSASSCFVSSISITYVHVFITVLFLCLRLWQVYFGGIVFSCRLSVCLFRKIC